MEKKQPEAERRRTNAEMQYALDHVLTVGSVNRRKAERFWEWRATGNKKKKVYAGCDMFHAEDARIYGGDNDAVWDLEHGDSTDPVAFSNARLSQVEHENVDGANLRLEDHPLETPIDQVPRALILRCWHRAVHAEASVVPCPQERDDGGGAEKDSQEAADEQVMYSRERAVAKCRAIHLIPAKGSLECLSCKTSFDTRQQMETHYYGAPNQRGCCWRQISLRQRKLVQLALEVDTRVKIKQVYELVARQAAIDNLDRPLQWNDVLELLEAAVKANPPTRNAEDPLAEFLQLNPNHPPIQLNDMILQNVRQRLVDRYADVPP